MIENGYYIVEVDGERQVAERCDDNWLPCGCDYDVWQYSDPPCEVKIIAKINLVSLMIEQVE